MQRYVECVKKCATLHSCKDGEQFLKLDNLVGVKWTEEKFSCYQYYFSAILSAILFSFFAVCFLNLDSLVPTLVGFRDGSAGKTSACNAGDTGDNVRSLGQEDPLK